MKRKCAPLYNLGAGSSTDCYPVESTENYLLDEAIEASGVVMQIRKSRSRLGRDTACSRKFPDTF